MMSLFSRFDYYWPNFPILAEVVFFFCIFACSFFKNSLEHALKFLNFFINNFFIGVSVKGYTKSLTHFFRSIFFFFVVLNFSSIFPFVLAHRAQVGVVLLFSLALWVCIISFYVSFNLKRFIAHCIPEGRPIPLIPALFLIELVSNVIRPITLTVRLVANILAGHLLLILLSKLVYSEFSILTLYLFLNIAEFFVALIQAYIFTTIITLYFCELN